MPAWPSYNVHNKNHIRHISFLISLTLSPFHPNQQMGDAVMDSELIEAFISPPKNNVDIFADSQWLSMPDQNQGSYTTGRLQFTTTNLRTQFVDYHNAYLVIPFSVTVPITPAQAYLGASTGTNWSTTVPPNVCFKSSVLDLVPGIQHSTDTGTSIINTLSGLDQYNAWLLNTEHNDEWANEYGPALCYAPDIFPNSALSVPSLTNSVRDPTNLPGISASSNTAAVATLANPSGLTLNANTSPYNATCACASGTASNNPNQAPQYSSTPNPYYNSGFKRRCDYFRDACTKVTYNANLTAWMFEGRFIVPLKYLHDFWMQDRAPKINVAYSTYFQIPWSNGSNSFNSPLMTDGLCGTPIITMLGAASSSATSIAGQGGAGTQGGACQLYYRSVTFGPEDNKKIVSQISDGTWQTVDYMIIQTPPTQEVKANAPINQNLTQAVAAPLRVVGFFTQPNALSSPLLLNQSSTVRLSGFNLLVNNTPLYKNAFQYDNEFWQIQQEQGNPNTGSVITYKDYTFNLRTIVADLQRLGDRLPSPNAPVSIQVIGTRQDTYAGNSSAAIVVLQSQWIIESRQTIKYKINTSSTDVIVGLVNGNK